MKRVDPRGLLYLAAKAIGDYRAIRRGRVAHRLARRAAGKLAGRLIGKLLG